MKDLNTSNNQKLIGKRKGPKIRNYHPIHD